MKISKMKKIVIVVLFSLTIFSLPTYIRCSQNFDEYYPAENYPDQLAVESSWRPVIAKPETKVQRQNYSIQHAKKYPSQVIALTDLDPLSGAASAQEYVEKALEIQKKRMSEKSDVFPSHSFMDYKSVKHDEPISDFYPKKRPKLNRKNAPDNNEQSFPNHRPRHKQSESRRLNENLEYGKKYRKSRRNHDEVSQESERVPKKRIQQQVKKTLEPEYERPKNKVKLSDTDEMPDMDFHKVHKKHKLNYFEEQFVPKIEPQRIRPKIKRPKKQPQVETQAQSVEPTKSAVDMTEIIADWTEHFKNIKDQQSSASDPITTYAKTSTTIRPKKRIRTKKPNMTSDSTELERPSDNFSSYKHVTPQKIHSTKPKYVDNNEWNNAHLYQESEKFKSKDNNHEHQSYSPRESSKQSQPDYQYYNIHTNHRQPEHEYQPYNIIKGNKKPRKYLNQYSEQSDHFETPKEKKSKESLEKAKQTDQEGIIESLEEVELDHEIKRDNKKQPLQNHSYKIRPNEINVTSMNYSSFHPEDNESTRNEIKIKPKKVYNSDVSQESSNEVKQNKDSSKLKDSHVNEGKINLKIENPESEEEEVEHEEEEVEQSNHNRFKSKSKTIQNADHSTSTNYYYEPTLTEVIEEAKEEEEKFKVPTFSNRSLSILNFQRGRTTPINDNEAYFMTHPTPNPPPTTSFPSNKNKLIYHPTPPRKPQRSRDENLALNASVYINSNNGVDSPFSGRSHILSEKSNPFIPMYKTRNIAHDKNVAESQIVEFRVNQSYAIQNTPEDYLKPHTPNFHLNEIKQTKSPVYYGNLNPTTSTTSPSSTVPTALDQQERFRGFFSSTVASIIESSLLRPSSTISPAVVTDETERSLMTYAPDDDIDDDKMNEDEVDKDLETSESGKNQYVVLYEYEAKPRRRPRPRHRTTQKPQLVTQQIHYHHHGNPSPPSDNKHSMGGSYQGSSGAKGPYDSDNDEGPDVTHTHHEYVHFDNEPSVTHLYNNGGPLTDHYNVGNPGANALYDLKSAKDYDFRHSASHDLDTRHVPVPDFDNLRYSHLHNAGQQGRVEQPLNFNSYGERPYYYYDSERQSDLYDLEAYGSSPQESVAKPFTPLNQMPPDQMQVETNQQNKLKITDPLNPTQTIEITKDEYVKHVKLAVEKYLKTKEHRPTTDVPPTMPDNGLTTQNLPNPVIGQPFFSGAERPFDGGNAIIQTEDEATIFVKAKPYPSPDLKAPPQFNLPPNNFNERPVHDMRHPGQGFHKPLERPIQVNDGPTPEMKRPLQGFQKPLERPFNYHEGHIADNKVPLNDDTYRHLRDTLESSYMTPIKPITLPPKKLQQLTRLVASTPSAFQPRPIPSIRPQHPPPNFNIMKYMKYPKGTYPAGKPLQDAIYNMQENLGNDVDLTNKHIRPNGRPDLSAIDVGQTYMHGTTNFDGTNGHPNGISNFPGSPKLKFNHHVYHDINSLPGKQNQYKDSEHAQSINYPEVKTLNSNKKQGSEHNVALNSAAFANELQNAPVQIINGVPISNPYNIDMDTLRFMLGGMPQGMTMTKDPNDPFNMQTLKSIPNIASVGNPQLMQSFPTIASAYSQQNAAYQKPPKGNQYQNQIKHRPPPPPAPQKHMNKVMYHHPNQPGLMNHPPSHKGNHMQPQPNGYSSYPPKGNHVQHTPHNQQGFSNHANMNQLGQMNQPNMNRGYNNQAFGKNANNFNIQNNPRVNNNNGPPHQMQNQAPNQISNQQSQMHNSQNQIPNPNSNFNNNPNSNFNNNPNSNFNNSPNPNFNNNNQNPNFINKPNNENALDNNVKSNTENPGKFGRSSTGPTTNGYQDAEFNNMNAKWNHYTPNANPFNPDPAQTPPPWLRDNTNVNSFNAARPTQEPQLFLRSYRRVPNGNNQNPNQNPTNNKRISSKHSRDPETNLRPPPRFRKKKNMRKY